MAASGGEWTEGDLDAALERAGSERDALAFVEVHLDPEDCSAALKRLGAALAEQRSL